MVGLMLTYSGKTEQELVEKLGVYTNKLIKSNISIWKNLDQKPMPKWNPEENGADFMLSLQHSTHCLGCFMAGFHQQSERLITRIGKQVLHETESVKQMMIDYSLSRHLDLEVKLWVDDLTRELSYASYYISQKLEGKTPEMQLYSQ